MNWNKYLVMSVFFIVDFKCVLIGERDLCVGVLKLFYYNLVVGIGCCRFVVCFVCSCSFFFMIERKLWYFI